MKIRLLAVGIVLNLLCSPPSFAAHPLATDDAGTNGQLKFQVETSAEFAWDKQNSVKTNSQSLNVALSAGLLESLDLSVAYPFSWQNVKNNNTTVLDNGGLNDLTLALKWRFLELGPASFAVKPSLTFPTGNYERGLGSGRASYGATLISTVEFKELPLPVAVHANAGYTRQQYCDADRDANRETLWNLSLAGTIEVLKGLQVVAEVGTVTNPDKASTVWPAFVTGGAIYSVLDGLDLSLGAKGALNKPEVDIALLAGITFKFP
jgi:hypothetical protein